MKHRFIAIVLVVLSLVAAGCAPDGGSAPEVPASAEPSATSDPGGAGDEY